MTHTRTCTVQGRGEHGDRRGSVQRSGCGGGGEEEGTVVLVLPLNDSANDGPEGAVPFARARLTRATPGRRAEARRVSALGTVDARAAMDVADMLRTAELLRCNLSGKVGQQPLPRPLPSSSVPSSPRPRASFPPPQSWLPSCCSRPASPSPAVRGGAGGLKAVASGHRRWDLHPSPQLVRVCVCDTLKSLLCCVGGPGGPYCPHIARPHARGRAQDGGRGDGGCGVAGVGAPRPRALRRFHGPVHAARWANVRSAVGGGDPAPSSGCCAAALCAAGVQRRDGRRRATRRAVCAARRRAGSTPVLFLVVAVLGLSDRALSSHRRQLLIHGHSPLRDALESNTIWRCLAERLGEA